MDELDPWAKLEEYDIYKSDDLFDRHSNVSWKYELDNFSVYYKHRKQYLLPKNMRARGFDRVQHFLYWVSRTHFKQKFQTSPERQDDRVLAFFEWAELFWFHKPNQLRFSFQKNFAAIEAVLQLRRLQIALPHNSCILNCKTKFVSYFIIYMVLKRENISFEDYYYANKGTLPTPRRVREAYGYLSLVEVNLSANCNNGVGYVGKERISNETYTSLLTV